eukprot:TRINITY_DN10018_c0_g3_i1.p1 TRINITY_DN10018_c0_g3~~TRINITY_DN10018_c0_g3_i1.p1  ORF type:complete len:327 (-),score=19.72 TRINITY_DN10018_c0_g3_i1:1104-1988(-)
MDSTSSAGTVVSRCTQSTQNALTWQTAINATSQTILRDAAGYLGTRDIASWQAVNIETKSVFEVRYEGASVWQRCAQSEFPLFYAEDELYEGAGRSRVLRCHALCLRAHYAANGMVTIRSFEEASFLENPLRLAFYMCEAHQTVGGRDAHVLVANFQMMKSGSFACFVFGAEGKPFIAGLPAGVLKMTLFRDGNNLDNLVTCAEYAEGDRFSFRPCTQAKHKQLKLIIWSGTPGIGLHYSGVPLILDGARRPWTGRRENNRSIPSGTDQALCVMALIEDDEALQSSFSEGELPL